MLLILNSQDELSFKNAKQEYIIEHSAFHQNKIRFLILRGDLEVGFLLARLHNRDLKDVGIFKIKEQGKCMILEC